MENVIMTKKSNDRRHFLKSGALLGSAAFLNGLDQTTTAAEHATSDKVDIWEAFSKRRSVRKFQPNPVPEEHLLKILDAAHSAPTSGNQQPWKFLVVRDKTRIMQLREGCVKHDVERFYEQYGQGQTQEEFANSCRQEIAGCFSAPVFIVVLTDNQSRYPTYNHWDGPLAAGYLMLAARALGYGTVHITDSIPEQITKEVLAIPDRYTRVCITPLGVPTEWPESPPKKKLQEFIAFESLTT